jgi:ABC-2 type transport system permease protein
MSKVWTIFRREFAGYFATPVAYVFLVIFLAFSGALTFYLGNFFERGQADLQSFFMWHPWLYLFLIPAIAMRLWSEERKQGTIELFLTLPISLAQAVLGKYLAAWAFTGVALVLTVPIWITINWLGEPDNGAVFSGYLGSFLMAGGFLAIGACISATTKSQVVAFVLTAALAFVFTVSGTGLVLNFFSGWAPEWLIDAIRSFSFLTHFNAMNRGVVDFKDIFFFGSLIALFLFVNAIVIDMKKAG